MKANNMIDVQFAHYRHVFESDVLSRYGSPHFSDHEVGKRLRKTLLEQVKGPEAELSVSLKRSQVLCSNEVFPEAAVADPLADLEVWEEWKTGQREFPYPGKYSPLGITVQEGKGSSNDSMGVVGEIMAGLFSQSYIAPFVTVRNIKSWPDFIFYTPPDERYAFVESKAFTRPKKDTRGLSAVPKKVMKGELINGLRQLLADPYVKIWLAFTNIVSIRPFSLRVTFLELDVPERKRRQITDRMIPEVVIKGLAQRALNLAGAELDQQAQQDLNDNAQRGKSNPRKMAETQLYNRAREMVEHLCRDAAPQYLAETQMDELKKLITKQAREVEVPPPEYAQRLTDAKERAVRGEYAPLREVAGGCICMADLSEQERETLESTWGPNWENVSKKWCQHEDTPVWRCSSALLGVFDSGPSEEEQQKND